MNLRSNKGINMITLSIAVLILVVITSTLVYNSKDGIKLKAANNLFNDIETLNNKVSDYYIKYGDIPKAAQYTNTAFLSNAESNQINPNNYGNYYVINLSALEGVTLNFGKGFNDASPANTDDVYIINEGSHTIYYPKGIVVKDKTYYTKPENWTSVDLSVIPIYKIEDLVRLSNSTNAGDTHEGDAAVLMNDLDFNDASSYEQYNRTDFGDINGNGTVEELKTELTTGQGFMPIGINRTDKMFKGILEGNNCTIKHLYIDVTKSDNGYGLFGNSNTIKNLTVADSYVKGVDCVGGIVGDLRTGYIENCHNKNTTVISKESATNGSVGGVVGSVREGDVINCTNTGLVEKKSDYTSSFAGGIVGSMYGRDTINCSNEGKVIAKGNNVGGICGDTYPDKSQNITDCYNSGEIISDSIHIGGIIGNLRSNKNVSNCSNTGTVTGSGIKIETGVGIHLGGVVGAASSGSALTNCSNTGVVTGNGLGVGGVLGTNYSGSVLTNCSNTGAVTGNAFVGGVCGYLVGTIEKSYNTGTVIHKGGVDSGLGGICGETGTNGIANILNCYNTGKVIEEENNTVGVGGIVGWISTTGASGEISHNYNIGEIEIKGTNVTNVGGAIGRYAATTFTINNNYYELDKSNVTLNNLAEGRTQANMKTQEFLNLLNGSQNPLVWASEIINITYPVLQWQLD